MPAVPKIAFRPCEGRGAIGRWGLFRPVCRLALAVTLLSSDIGKLYAWPHTNVSSDGGLDGAHPRGYGAFPRVLATYVRTDHAITLEDAIRKMTSLAAAHVGLTRRGTITPGAFADLVLFDPATVTDNATPAAPHLVSTGVEGVWVNGRAVWRSGKTTGDHPGRVISRVPSPVPSPVP